MKPIVGINLDVRKGFAFLAISYIENVERAGAIPLLLPPINDDCDLLLLLDEVHAMVLAGGADLDCRNDGYYLHKSMRTLDPRRETFDRRLAGAIIAQHKPVLGIGCGMQLLNVCSGGTLMLDIATDVRNPMPHWNAKESDVLRHSLKAEPGSFIARTYAEEICVNSMHHQAVDDLGTGFRRTAWSRDGVIEAMESTDPRWLAIGIQFHPEHETATAIDRCVFDNFVDWVKIGIDSNGTSRVHSPHNGKRGELRCQPKTSCGQPTKPIAPTKTATPSSSTTGSGLATALRPI